jgi:hypothetical protein
MARENGKETSVLLGIIFLGVGSVFFWFSWQQAAK